MAFPDDGSLEIVEGVESVWHYHLRRIGEKAALCGSVRIMQTQIPTGYWGMKADHIPESYCSLCQQRALSKEQ